MAKDRADLHVHTYFSDGTQSVEEAAKAARDSGVDIMAFTDHDCDLAFDEGRDICAGFGLTLVRGMEISAYEGDVKVHTLGYRFDSSLKAAEEEMFSASFERARIIVKKLERAGICLDMDEIENMRHSPAQPIHAMHIARAAVKAGYAEDRFSFYGRYIGPGTIGFTNEYRFSPARACREFESARGFSVLAHPGRIEMDEDKLTKLVSKMKDEGLGGIEAFYPTHTRADIERFLSLAKRYDLVPTGGSDCHGQGGHRRIGDPEFHANSRLLEKLL